MSGNKTVKTETDVRAFVDSIEHKTRRADTLILLDLFGKTTGLKPVIWGENLIGYGTYHYRYESGREGDFFLTGFSPRKTAMTIYIMPGFGKYREQLSLLGPHKHSVSCLYITRLARVDLVVLEQIIADSVEQMKAMYAWEA